MYRFAIFKHPETKGNFYRKGVYQSTMLLSETDKLKGFRCEQQDTIELCLYDGLELAHVDELVGRLKTMASVVVHEIDHTTFI